MSRTIFILGAVFLFLLYRQNPEIVIFGAVAFVLWKVISSIGKAKAEDPSLKEQQKMTAQIQLMNQGLRTLVKQLGQLQQATPKEVRDTIEVVERVEHYSTK